jgi:hypothetical protein
MSGRQITIAATHTARSIRRRLAAAAARERREQAGGHVRGATEAREASEAAAEQRADDARLDTLRGELVHELDRLAAMDHGCSAGFRRI